MLVQCKLVIFLRIFHQALRHDAVFVHLLRAFHAELQKRHVRAFRVDFVPLQRGFCGLQRRFGGLQIRAVSAHGRLELHFIEVGKDLPLLHAVAVIYIELFHDAAGLRFHFHFGKWLDLARCDNHTRQVAAFDRSELRGINRVIGAESRFHPVARTQQDHRGHRGP